MLTGEDWNAVMYNGMRAYKADGPLFGFVVIYFVIVFVVGNCEFSAVHCQVCHLQQVKISNLCLAVEKGKRTFYSLVELRR